jgi:hypothetical protein
VGRVERQHDIGLNRRHGLCGKRDPCARQAREHLQRAREIKLRQVREKKEDDVHERPFLTVIPDALQHAMLLR